MIIDCYVFSDIALEPNHTYYNIENYKLLLYYLKDYHVDSFSTFTFIYKIKVNSEDVHYLGKYGLYALKYQVVEEVPFRDFVTELSLPSLTKAEIMSIIKGTLPEHKVIKKYEELLTLNKKYYPLSSIYTLKLHAILSQNHYKLPVMKIRENSGMEYVRILKFFNKPYIPAFRSNDSTFDRFIEIEELYGSKDFETGVELPMKELVCHINLKQYIETRKLSQEQFEEYCEYMFTEERTIYYTSHAIAAGYKILPKYKKHFYPYLIYSDPEMALELLNKRNLTRTEVIYFYEKNYKIGDYNYSNDKVRETKAIFVKEDDYKCIEVAT